MIINTTITTPPLPPAAMPTPAAQSAPMTYWPSAPMFHTLARLPIEKVVKAMTPFFIALLVVLGLVTYIPAISLWLPNLLLK